MQALNAAEVGGGAGGAADRESRELRIGRLQRQKVRVSRKRILESAIKVMELYARQRAVLELEYFNEVGTGLGPTLEFYTLLSHDLQRRTLRMWRHEDAEVVEYFRLLGRSLGKALQDSRLMDLPLNYTFYRYKADLGDAEFELVPGGKDQMVTSQNLGRWIEAVVDATVGSGIAAQVEAFQEGFNEVFLLASLDTFYEDEIETMLCGAGEHWTVQGLLEEIKFDHGYTASSPVVKALVEVLAELDPLDQRRFLRFVT
ncbi:predicted protein, partial [Haematococcus lacustris]